MKIRLLFSLISGALVYIVITLIGLISFHSLLDIFRHGIIAFIIIFILSYILVLMIQIINKWISQHKSNKKREENKKDNNGKENNVNDSEEEEEEFSPMQPPVIEYEENMKQ